LNYQAKQIVFNEKDNHSEVSSFRNIEYSCNEIQ
jgi:hypothetical protein